MKIIKSYFVQPGRQQLMLPCDTILSTGCLQNNIVLYVLTDTEDQYDRPFETAVFDTNQQIDDLEGFFFAGTVKMEDGRILHVFYKCNSSIDL